MSISTQPTARHASLQRALSARLNAPIGMDTAAIRTGSADKIQRPEIATMDYVSWPRQLGNSAAQTLCSDGSSSDLPQLTELPAQGLLPAIASELASQIQARKCASLNCQPNCIPKSGPAYCEADDVSRGSAHDLLKQSSKRARSSPITCTEIRLAQQAASLEDEFAAMKAGTAVIADRTAWIAAARRTAHQVEVMYAWPLSTASRSLHCYSIARFCLQIYGLCDFLKEGSHGQSSTELHYEKPSQDALHFIKARICCIRYHLLM